jgi:hypothetical protein
MLDAMTKPPASGMRWAQFGEFCACPFHHCGLVTVEQGRAPVRLILRRASKPVEIQDPLETRDPFQFRGELGRLTTRNVNLRPVLEVDRELAFVPVKRNRPAISEVNSVTIGKRIGSSIWLVDSAGIIIGKPHELRAIGSNWRSRQVGLSAIEGP